jgi:uncharacterized membrane protein SpoIIM required for sporulation
VSGFTLKSYEFRREREQGWRALEALLARADKVGVHGLDADELHRLPVLYRAAVTSLSVARAISLDRNLVAYLESLAARAHLRVYGAKEGTLAALQRFVRASLPSLVRELGRWLVVSIALLAVGVLAGFSLVAHDLDRYEALVPSGFAQGRGPASTREELLDVLRGSGGRTGNGEETQEDEGSVDLLAAFAGFLFAHNSQVGMLCFALGFAAGVPVVLLLFSNGLLLGALAGLHHHKGLDLEFWGWVLPHGVTELLAVALCGAAGLALGRALVVPGRFGRLQELARAGRRVAPVVLGAVGLFLVAALIEGFFRQLVVGEVPRYLLAGASVVFWAWYFTRVGRTPDGGADAGQANEREESA